MEGPKAEMTQEQLGPGYMSLNVVGKVGAMIPLLAPTELQHGQG